MSNPVKIDILVGSELRRQQMNQALNEVFEMFGITSEPGYRVGVKLPPTLSPSLNYRCVFDIGGRNDRLHDCPLMTVPIRALNNAQTGVTDYTFQKRFATEYIEYLRHELAGQCHDSYGGPIDVTRILILDPYERIEKPFDPGMIVAASVYWALFMNPPREIKTFVRDGWVDRLQTVVPETTPQDSTTVHRLPDDSAFFTAQQPLPKDHWLYQDEVACSLFIEVTPEEHADWHKQLLPIFRNAIRGATNFGREMDFDPDALVQNLMVGTLGPYPAPTPKKPGAKRKSKRKSR